MEALLDTTGTSLSVPWHAPQDLSHGSLVQPGHPTMVPGQSETAYMSLSICVTVTNYHRLGGLATDIYSSPLWRLSKINNSSMLIT